MIFFNYKITFYRFGKKYRKSGSPPKKIFDVFNKILAHVILEIFFSPTFLFGLYLNMTFKMCPIDLNHPLQHLLVENINIHIPFSLFSILKHSICFKTHDTWQKGVMVLIVTPQLWMHPNSDASFAKHLEVF
jgi:hypothetical protein